MLYAVSALHLWLQLQQIIVILHTSASCFFGFWGGFFWSQATNEGIPQSGVHLNLKVINIICAA